MKLRINNQTISFKQGGTLKAQPGTILPTIPSALTKAYDKLDSALTPISKWESKYNVKANASLGPLELLNPEAWVGIDISTLDKAHKGVELVKEVPKLNDIPIPITRTSKKISQPVTKSEKGLYSYVKNHHPEDLANWEKYMEEYMKFWKKKK